MKPKTRMDEIKPRCPKCNNISFEAVVNSSIVRAEKSIVMIVCQDDSCRTVIGVLPIKEVFSS